jgi:hypothetical protein
MDPLPPGQHDGLADSLDPPSPLEGHGRHGPRSRSGCWTCRTKKVKCDEERPLCHRCMRLKLFCDYAPRTKLRGPKSRQTRPPTVSTRASNVTHMLVAQPNFRHWFQQTFERDDSQSLSLLTLPAPTTGACSLELTAADHESIRYFRTSFAKLHHTKNPDYSMYSIMFNVAQQDPAVMHMILALGSREIEFRRRRDGPSSGPRTPLQHYSSALRMMADAIGREDEGRLDFDSVYTVLYLMIMYEQKYGDPKCSGLSNHLTGTSLILKHRCKNLLRLPAPSPETQPKLCALTKNRNSEDEEQQLSLYSARLLVWIALADSAAASTGVGGQVNGTLYKVMSEIGDEYSMDGSLRPIDSFTRLHRFSNPLYRTIWGESYPQDELLDDVENRNIYALVGECAQLRFMISQLANLSADEEISELRRRNRSVDLAVQQVGYKYVELIEVASELSITTNNDHRLVANIRSIVPFYYGVVLEYLRLQTFIQPQAEPSPQPRLTQRQRNALRGIMNLAFQTFKHDGNEAMARIAYPLFMVGIETDDLLHREWVLGRFQAISGLGKNYERAHQFLLKIISIQDNLGQRVNVRNVFNSGDVEAFVI